MATEKIRIDYEVDKKQLDESNKSLKKTAELNELTQKEVDETNEKFKEQGKTLSKTNKLFSSLGGQLQSIGNRFQIAGKGAGDLAAGMFKATNATSGTSKAMKILKVAIASTGIGLLIIALGSLATAFVSSEKGQDAFLKIMGKINVVIGNVSDVFASFGDQLISFFSGDGFDSSKIVQAIDDVIQKTGEEIALSDKLADKRAATNKLEREFLVKSARLESEVADLRLKGRQEDEFTAKERLAFLNTANDLQNELITTELTIAKARAEEVKISNTFSKSTRENKEEEARLEAVVFQIEAKRLNQQRTLQREINTTSKQQEAALEGEEKAKQAVIDADDAAREEQKAKDAEELAFKKSSISELTAFRLEQQGLLVDAELERRRLLLEDEELIEEERLLIIEESEARILELKSSAIDEEQDLKAKAVTNQKALDDQLLANKQKSLDQGFTLAKSFAGKDTSLAKGIALSEIFIDTRRAVQKSVAISPATFGQPFAGFAVASGLVNAAAVSGVLPKFEKGGKIGGNLHSGGGTVIEAEKDEFVMSRKATSKYGFDFMDKINNLELNDITSDTGSSTVNVIDTSQIAKQLKNMPQNIMNVDSEGFTLHQRRGQNTMSQKLTRYST